MLSKHKERKRQERLEAIALLKPKVEAAFMEISAYYSFIHYITDSERLMLAEKYDSLDLKIKPLLGTKELEESPEKEIFQRFHTSAIRDTQIATAGQRWQSLHARRAHPDKTGHARLSGDLLPAGTTYRYR